MSTETADQATVSGAGVDGIAEAARGLRELADVLEAHPDAVKRLDLTGTHLLMCRVTAEDFAATARALGPFERVEDKDRTDGGKYLTLVRTFGPIELHLYIGREKVGERAVVTRPVETFELHAPMRALLDEVVA